MKKTMIILAASLILPVIAYAMYGGDVVTYNLTNCTNLAVNITNVSVGEWSIYPNCTEETAGNFYCNCTNNWTLYLSPKINSVGDYKVTITDYQSFETTTQTTTVFLSTGSGGTIFVPTNVTTTITTSIPGSTITQTVTLPPTNATQTTTVAPSANPITGLFALPTFQYSIILLIIALTIMFILWKYLFKKNSQPEPIPQQ